MFEMVLVLYFIALIGSGVYALNRLIRYRAAGRIAKEEPTTENKETVSRIRSQLVISAVFFFIGIAIPIVLTALLCLAIQNM